MIPRYSRPDMASIWEPQTRFRIWFEIEAHAADAMAELGIIPKDAAATIWAKGRSATFDIARVDAQMGNFKGRIVRDRWVEQARLLADGDIAGFEATFGKLG